MHPFEQYLTQHDLEPLAVAVKAKIRYMTIWNALKGIPISPEHAQKIRRALHQLTGTPYTGPLVLTQEPPLEQLPTLPMRTLPRDTAEKGKRPVS